MTVPIPESYRRTSRGHVTVDGVQFFSYRVSINRYAMISEDGRLWVQRNFERTTYWACIRSGGEGQSITIGRRYLTEKAAMAAAVKAAARL
ncbi:MAG TPA: hypothetical protein VKT73_13050 [Xanthobacteraceae bacterium]|nr:hypothetical protein [Xanthobacteraceae bacterium]